LPPPHVKWKRVEDEAQKQIPYRRRCLGRDQARIAAELDERSRHLVRGEPATELLMQGGGLGGELPRHPIAARRQVLIDEAAALRWASRRWEVLEVDGPVQSRSVVVQVLERSVGRMLIRPHRSVQVVVVRDAAEGSQVGKFPVLASLQVEASRQQGEVGAPQVAKGGVWPKG